MKKILVLLLSFLVLPLVNAQTDAVYNEFTSKESRQKTRQEIVEKTIKENLSLPLNEENENKWSSAFWGMELLLYKDDFTTKKIEEAFKVIDTRSIEFQRSLLEVVYTLYPEMFARDVGYIARETDNPKLFAMAINYLQRIGNKNTAKTSIALLKNNFPDFENNPILHSLKVDLDIHNLTSIYIRPSLIDLFKNNYRSKPVIFSIQRSNRDYPGLIVIKNGDGKFLRNENGSIFHVPQLARAISNLPGYITNGNTPQGIFSIQGIDTSENDFIGQTPNLQSVLPSEVTTAKYFHDESLKKDWSIDLYKDILPNSWKNYEPFYRAYYAGKAGRNEIIVHGTTIDPDYYYDKIYYPNTPTLGCLCAKEIWSDEGKLLYSDQQAIINAYQSTGSNEGYLVVVEIDSKSQPVTLEDILIDLIKSEE